MANAIGMHGNSFPTTSHETYRTRSGGAAQYSSMISSSQLKSERADPPQDECDCLPVFVV